MFDGEIMDYLPYIMIVLVLISSAVYHLYTLYNKRVINNQLGKLNNNMNVNDLKNNQKNLKVKINDDFVAAKDFAGPKPGYVFKKGPKGQGYYLENK
tara:strand:+ start:81 stop:371 length:291 start_codon:yes stop_codon:yes gene_type:complete